MPSNCLPERMQSHSDCICLTFLHCVFKCFFKLLAWVAAYSHRLHLLDLSPLCFSSVPSNCLPERMQSHIGCTCSTFLQYEFSNVFLICPAQAMHSHIGYSCLPFLHCEFSNVSSNYVFSSKWRGVKVTLVVFFTFLRCAFPNVSSNGLPVRMHIHIGCICLTFLHCGFSNVSSNGLHKRMHSYIGCIFLVFLHYVWSNLDPFLIAEGKEKTWSLYHCWPLGTDSF